MTYSIRFPHTAFSELRQRLAEHRPDEAFAVLLAAREVVAAQTIFKVVALRYPDEADYTQQGSAHLGIARPYIYEVLAELQNRLDVDTLIDVHTHPFCAQSVAFSSVDDHDEQQFCRFLNTQFDDIHYASLVLSQSDYSARVWHIQANKPSALPAEVRTQTRPEHWPCADTIDVSPDKSDPDELNDDFLARTRLALGHEVLAQMCQQQRIVVIGAGGLGSAVAENLIHMGFNHLALVDPDRIELSNLNRVVGAYYDDVQEQSYKVDVIENHLASINPNATIETYPWAIEDERLWPVLAQATWLIVTTDTHASRHYVQQKALQFYVPLLSAGVNITVTEEGLRDMSGEVITVRAGDRLCLNCLGRVNPTQIAAEQHPDPAVREKLVQRGYVKGMEVKEPAVKTLNAMVAALTVETLINQFTTRQAHYPIMVYENNIQPALFPDTESVQARSKDCFVCYIGEPQ